MGCFVFLCLSVRVLGDVFVWADVCVGCVCVCVCVCVRLVSSARLRACAFLSGVPSQILVNVVVQLR